MATEVQQLSDLMASSVLTLLKTYKENNTPFPGPNEPFTPKSEAFRASQIAVDATNVIAAATLQLAERVLPPHVSVMNLHFRTAALRTALELHVTGIFCEAGSEVAPDVYANTRISSVMDSGNCVVDLFNNPEDKHTGTHGLVAFMEQLIGDRGKFSLRLLENLKDPKYRRRRFAVVVKGMAQMQPSDILDEVIDWKALPKDSVVADVRGGIGTSSIAIALSQETILRGHQCGQAFMPHDFFASQPVANASVFILKQILHSWADPYSARILRSLRAAPLPDTNLIIVDNIVAYACLTPDRRLRL
ncbi:hypothetical protein DXG01_010876 [Tephrocybe rancida]|nr:hypothetical protein DXG01_010876 [Tephrocybe rancida]